MGAEEHTADTADVAATGGVVAIVGAGVMGETLLSGLLRAGRPPASLLITEKRAERAAELAERYGVRGGRQRRRRAALRPPSCSW